MFFLTRDYYTIVFIVRTQKGATKESPGYTNIWRFLTTGGPFLRDPIVRIMVYVGASIGAPDFWKLPFWFLLNATI